MISIHNVDEMKWEIRELKGKLNRTDCVCELDTCLIYVRLKHCTMDSMSKSFLEAKLNTTILDYDVIHVVPTPAFRIKIKKCLLHNALTHARSNGCVADIWGGAYRIPSPKYSQAPINSTVRPSVSPDLTITCRGLSTGLPYINSLGDLGLIS